MISRVLFVYGSDMFSKWNEWIFAFRNWGSTRKHLKTCGLESWLDLCNVDDLSICPHVHNIFIIYIYIQIFALFCAYDTYMYIIYIYLSISSFLWNNRKWIDQFHHRSPGRRCQRRLWPQRLDVLGNRRTPNVSPECHRPWLEKVLQWE